ncbi:MAG: twin-arginine translocation signal domain-containing protein [Proteobacteria bacterium]|nr:twin-arginine translocation signal domain-containing protein [Pseudomonadota bacterium]
MRKKQRNAETRYREEEGPFSSPKDFNRRGFLKFSTVGVAALLARGLLPPTNFLPARVNQAEASAGTAESFRFAYISDSHLYEKDVNDRFVRSLLRAVDDVNNLDPQPDFVLYGGDLAQLGQPMELVLGAQILKNLKAPVKMMVGEHDWYLDMGEKWQELFGKPTYSWDYKGIHFVTLNSVVERDFWTKRGMTPMERMKTVAGLDNGVQSPFMVGEEQREWLRADLATYTNDTPIIVFSHSPLYKLYKFWNFWTDDAEEVQAVLKRFNEVVVIHGHTHQLLTNRIGNIHYHGMLSTAWPWPYAPEGMPELTIEMNRSDPFNPNDGCGDGEVRVYSDGLVDKIYNLWNRNLVTIPRAYTASWGKEGMPPKPNLASY